MKCYGKWPVCTELKRQVPKQCLVSFIFHPTLFPPGGLSYKDGGLLVGNFEKNPQRYQDPPLWAWLEIFFTPKRYQFLSYSSCEWHRLFWDQYLKRYGEIFCLGTFWVWTLQEVPNLLFNPQNVRIPLSFLYGITPPPLRPPRQARVQHNIQYNFISLR